MSPTELVEKRGDADGVVTLYRCVTADDSRPGMRSARYRFTPKRATRLPGATFSDVGSGRYARPEAIAGLVRRGELSVTPAAAQTAYLRRLERQALEFERRAAEKREELVVATDVFRRESAGRD